MAESSELRRELAQVDRHVAEGEARITRQAEVVRELAADGHDTTAAAKLLLTLRESLAAMQAHRVHIVRELTGFQTAATFSARR